MHDDPTRSSPRVLRLPQSATLGAGTPDYQITLLDGLVVAGWYGDVTTEGIGAWRDAVEQVAQRTGGPVGLITCVRESSPPPDGELRRSAAKILFHDSIAISMLVFEGTGFRAAIVRSVLAMMFAIGGNRNTAHKVFGDPAEATRWFMQHSAKQPWCPDRGELREVIDALLTAT